MTPEMDTTGAEARRAYHRDYNRARRAAGSVADREACRRWRAKNVERERDRARQWRAANRDSVASYNARWREDNVTYAADWRSANLARCKAYLANYRGRKAHATPGWADADQIAAIYVQAERLTRDTGIPHEVDHVIPLCGKNVCGLHVHTNLQVIPASVNRSKGNRFDG